MKGKTKFIIGMGSAALTAAILASCGAPKTYTVAFQTNGGVPVESLKVEWGKTFEAPITTKEGYTFTGWYTDTALQYKYDTTKGVEADFTLYAGWELKTYTITFVTGEGASKVDPIKAAYNQEVSPKSPTRPYYTFFAWYSDPSFAEDSKFNNLMPKNDITLYAKWTANKVEVIFNKNSEEATGSMENQYIDETSEHKNLSENKFKRTGYEFKGWATSPTETAPAYLDKQEFAPHIEASTSITLYAVWEKMNFSVSFFATNENNNLAQYGETYSSPYGDNIVTPEISPVLLGHEFKGWGKMVRTSDETISIEKEYFKRSGDSDAFVKVYNNPGETISETLYEVSLVNMGEEKVGLTNQYFAKFVKVQTTVNFVSSLDNEKIYSTLIGYYGAFVGEIENPVEEHYTFEGWYAEATCNNRVDVSKLKFGAINSTVYAKFSLNKHALTFKDGNDTLHYVNAQEYGTSVLGVYTPEARTGYDFEGWYLEPELLNKFEGTMPDNDLTLYAKFVAHVHKVHLSGVEGASDLDVPYGSLLSNFVPSQGSKKGYNPQGWFYGGDVSRPLGKTDTMGDEDISLVALWEVQKYVVKYEGGSSHADASINFGSTFKDLLPEESRQGYIFVGWFFNGELVSNDTVVDEEYPGGIVLTASWAPDFAKVTFNYLGTAIGGTTYTETIKESESVSNVYKTEQCVYVTEEDAPAIEGFKFASCNAVTVAADGSTVVNVNYDRLSYDVTFRKVGGDEIVTKQVEYKDTIKAIPTEVTSLANKETISYSVDGNPINVVGKQVTEDLVIDVTYTSFPGLIIDGNGGTFGDKEEYSDLIKTGDEINFPEDPIRVGYTFKGYYEKGDETETIINKTGKLMPEGGLELVAKWEINQYTVSFVTGDSEVVVNSMTRDYGTVLEENASDETKKLPSPTRVGYTFGGWYLSTDESKTKLTSYTIGTLDVEMVAIWNENQINVSFDGNGFDGGSMEEFSVKFTDKDTMSFPDCGFTRTGYTFLGWSLTKDGEIVIGADDVSTFKFVASDFSSLQVNKKYYAVWKVDEHILTLDADNGSDPVEVAYNYGDAIAEPEDPIKAGYDFAGWYTTNVSGELVSLFNFETGKMGTSDFTLKAKWTIHKHNIQFNAEGGSACSAITNIEYGASLKDISLPTPTKEGYDFAGWYTAEGTYADDHTPNDDWGSKVDATYLTTATMGDENITYYAMWTPHVRTITYSVHGTTWGTANVAYGDEIVAPEYENKDYEVLEGWYTDEACTQEYVFGDAMGDINFTLYANFYYVEYYGDGSSNYIFGTSNTSTYGFMEYVEETYYSIEGYNFVYEAINNAVNYNATGGLVGNIVDFAAINVYATVGGLSDAELAQLIGAPVGYLTRTQMLVAIITNQVPAAVGQAISEDRAAQIVGVLDSCLPYLQNVEYYQTLAANGAGRIESTAVMTSGLRETAAKTYTALEENAYSPVGNNESRYFDSWTSSADSTNQINKVTANFVEKAKPVTNLEVVDITTSSMTISFDAVENAYGYRITYVITDSTGTTIANGEEVITDKTTYQINGLVTGYNVEVSVETLKKGEDGNYKASVAARHATSIADPTVTLNVPEITLDSDAVTLNYTHTKSGTIEEGTVSGAGNYYYIVEVPGQPSTIVLFTDTQYPFTSDSYLHIGGSNTAGAVAREDGVDGDGKPKTTISTSSKVGEFQILDGSGNVKYNAEVRAMPSGITLGQSLKDYSMVSTSNNAKGYLDVAPANRAKFLGEKTELYRIGTENGYKFDFNFLSNRAKEINIQKSYKFYDEVGNLISDPSTICDYNEETDKFTFKVKGIYKVVVDPKADGAGYTNLSIPNIIKSNAELMLANYHLEFRFEVTDGVNVTNNEELRAAFDNLATKVVNIHNNIKADLPANSYVYVGEQEINKDNIETSGDLGRLSKTLRNNIMGDLKHGDSRIVDNTAEMVDDETYGPKVWAENDENYVFTGADGKHYAYVGYDAEATNRKVIKSAQFTSDFDNGNFKIIGFTNPNASLRAQLGGETLHYRYAYSYNRAENFTNGFTVNGNYFKVDGSSIPFVRTNAHVNEGIAAYEIQSVHTCMFSNVSPAPLNINNLSIIGNTQNQSAAINPDGSAADIKKIMEKTSGGINGLRGTDTVGAVINTNSVNISNTLIGAYLDEGGSVNYSHISNSWANAIYAWGASTIKVSVANSVLESSGGCAYHVEDKIYTLDKTGSVTNPTIAIDFSTTNISNQVSGEEQWFKGHGMETIALGLKTTIDSQLGGVTGGGMFPNGLTILKEVTDPVSGLVSEKMNWVSFTQTTTPSDGSSPNPLDCGATIELDKSYLFISQYEAAPGYFIDVNKYVQIGADGNPVMNADGTVNIMMIIDASTAGFVNGTPFQPASIPVGGDGSYLIIYAKADLATGSLAGLSEMYLYFKMNAGAELGYVQGVVEVYTK